MMPTTERLVRMRVWVWSEPVDMRKSYNGLTGLVREKYDALSGELFLFISADRRRAKCLFWDGTGINIWMKRMEKGRFAEIWNRKQMTVSELRLFFEGSTSVRHSLSPKDLTERYVA